MNFWPGLPKSFTILAPMEGVTDCVFRELMTRTTRPDVFFTEFVSVDGILSPKNHISSRMLQFTPNQHPIVAQLWGLDPAKFALASIKIAELGFDGIDINLGCPVKKVITKGACAAMIGNYTVVAQIIFAVKSAGLPVSVKTRLGFDKIITENWITFLLQQNIQALTVHGRIATQMSKGSANWAEITKAVSLRNQISPKTLIIGNGDIQNYAQAQQASQKYGVDGVMIGRGVLDNPWAFDPNPTPHSPQEYLALLKKHLELFAQTYGESGHYHTLKRFFKTYLQNFPAAKSLRISLMSTSSCPQAIQILSETRGLDPLPLGPKPSVLPMN